MLDGELKEHSLPASRLVNREGEGSERAERGEGDESRGANTPTTLSIVTRWSVMPLLILLFGLAVRAATLGYIDLVDPTESRYAVIAQKMVQTGDWLTPTLPMPTGDLPYLGKPPLHFWFTALSLELFGEEQWGARFPSLLATVSILLVVMVFCRRFFREPIAVGSGLIYLTSAMGFFLAGASVTDVTLSACVTGGVAFLFSSVSGLAKDDRQERLCALVATVFGALGFLTKGPVSLVLTWGPILLWSGVRRDLSWRRRFPWVHSILLFLGITLPWFILSELHNPGFLQYFLWNENIARYLFRNYGDLYGSGHVRPYGTSWLMLGSTFLPWTAIFALSLWFLGWRKSHALLAQESNLLFIVCWSLFAPLFFTFVRQLHPMYLLPALPPLSILTARLFVETPWPKWANKPVMKLFPVGFFLLCGSAAFVAGAVLRWNPFAVRISGVLLVIGAVALAILSKRGRDSSVENLARFGAAVVGIYLVALVSVTPFLNVSNSAQSVVKKIALSEECSSQNGEQQIAVATQNTFSHYWEADVLGAEGANKVRIVYVDPERADRTPACYFIYQARSLDRVPQKIRGAFQMVDHQGGWFVFRRKEPLKEREAEEQMITRVDLPSLHLR